MARRPAHTAAAPPRPAFGASPCRLALRLRGSMPNTSTSTVTDSASADMIRNTKRQPCAHTHTNCLIPCYHGNGGAACQAAPASGGSAAHIEEYQANCLSLQVKHGRKGELGLHVCLLCPNGYRERGHDRSCLHAILSAIASAPLEVHASKWPTCRSPSAMARKLNAIWPARHLTPDFSLDQVSAAFSSAPHHQKHTLQAPVQEELPYPLRFHCVETAEVHCTVRICVLQRGMLQHAEGGVCPPTDAMVSSRPNARPRDSGSYMSEMMDCTHGSTSASPTPFKATHAVTCEAARVCQAAHVPATWAIFTLRSTHTCKDAVMPG